MTLTSDLYRDPWGGGRNNRLGKVEQCLRIDIYGVLFEPFACAGAQTR